MNLPRYEFHEENKTDLLKFIEKANQNKSNPYCNKSVYKDLALILPRAYILEKYPKEVQTVHIIDDDEDDDNQAMDKNEIIHNQAKNLENIVPSVNESIADISFAVKEILQSKTMSGSLVLDLHKPNVDLFNLFTHLCKELTFENIADLGILLTTYNISNENIILAYLRHMLIEQLNLEYSIQLEDILNLFYLKYPEMVTEELSKQLVNTTDIYKRATLQYIDRLTEEHKNKLLKKFCLHCNNLQENHLALIEYLIGNKVETNILSKLVELMAKAAENFEEHKAFGKLLLKVIQLLEKNICMLEKPLNHIISSHKSIWKTKVQKLFNQYLEDNFLLSQSLRY